MCSIRLQNRAHQVELLDSSTSLTVCICAKSRTIFVCTCCASSYSLSSSYIEAITVGTQCFGSIFFQNVQIKVSAVLLQWGGWSAGCNVAHVGWFPTHLQCLTGGSFNVKALTTCIGLEETAKESRTKKFVALLVSPKGLSSRRRYWPWVIAAGQPKI